MSSIPNRTSPSKADRNAAVDLEVPSGVADDIEAVLRSFAEEAELDTSLVVDHSGFLIAGISSVAEVDVDSIGTLVAGACGATCGLTGALGENGKVESIHLGEDRLLYLKEVGERFILVGVSDSNVPAGILRDQADRIEKPLSKCLSRVKAVPKSLTQNRPEPTLPEPSQPVAKSLRQPPPPQTKITTVVAKQKPTPQTVAKVTPAKPLPQVISSDSVPSSVFEVETDIAEEEDQFQSPEPTNAPIESKNPKPRAIVENSPFEVDFEDDVETATTRPPTKPVHLTVPAARKRNAEAQQQNQDDSDSGPRYSFELG